MSTLVPATQEAEAEGLNKLMSSGPVLSAYQDPLLKDQINHTEHRHTEITKLLFCHL